MVLTQIHPLPQELSDDTHTQTHTETERERERNKVSHVHSTTLFSLFPSHEHYTLSSALIMSILHTKATATGRVTSACPKLGVVTPQGVVEVTSPRVSFVYCINEQYITVSTQMYVRLIALFQSL